MLPIQRIPFGQVGQPELLHNAQRLRTVVHRVGDDVDDHAAEPPQDRGLFPGICELPVEPPLVPDAAGNVGQFFRRRRETVEQALHRVRAIGQGPDGARRNPVRPDIHILEEVQEDLPQAAVADVEGAVQLRVGELATAEQQLPRCPTVAAGAAAARSFRWE